MSFHNSSEYCYEWLKNQPCVKEESLTDWLLYNASKSCSKVFYRAFARNEEAHNGADWEWWIIVDKPYGTRAYRLLVQAKKLRAGGDNYPLVTYSNKNGMQIDLLIKEAKKRNALPLYAYYSCCHPDINQQLKNVKYVPESLLKKCAGYLDGCFLTSAFDLHKNIFCHPRRKLNEQELINSSFGLSAFDDILNKTKRSKRFLNCLNNLYLHSDDSEGDSRRGIEYYEQILPEYVKSLMDGWGQENLLMVESQFRYDLEPLAGIVIIDARTDR